MKKAGLLAFAALGISACQDVPTSAPAVQADAVEREYIPDQYIVVYDEDVRDARLLTASLADRAGATVRYSYGSTIRGFAGRMSADAAAELARHPSVAYVEQDQVVHAVGTQTNATWGLDRIDQRALPLSTTYTYGNDGSGVNAYIIDTGIRFSHSEFVGRAASGYDAVDGGSADDCNGHGTHVAGTVGGTTYGVAKGARLVAVRVLDCGGSGSWSGVIAGMDWVAANHQKPATANMSLGGGASTAVDDATRRMIAAGVATVVAAGNGNMGGVAQDACKYSPARVADALTIGATTRTDAKTSWSNYGACVDFFAPGSGITSAWYTGDAATNTISGTSMAAPHVAGVAALYLQSNPAASPAAVSSALSAATTKGVVTSSKTANNHLLFTAY
jgi:subtilisin family serine protease